MKPTQAQRVGDNRDARQAHGRAGDGGVEQAEGGGGQRDDVVAEGPGQVLLDRAQRGARQADRIAGGTDVARDERQVRRLDGDVRAGPDGEAKVGLREGGITVNNPATGIGLGDLSSGPPLIAWAMFRKCSQNLLARSS